MVRVKPFTPDSAKSKIDPFSRITNWGKLKVLPNSFPMNCHTLGFSRSMESKVRKLCITQAFTPGIKGLNGGNCPDVTCLTGNMLPYLCLSSVLIVRSTDSCCINDSSTGCDRGQGDCEKSSAGSKDSHTYITTFRSAAVKACR